MSPIATPTTSDQIRISLSADDTRHLVFNVGGDRDFVLFNNEPLSDEEFDGSDLSQVRLESETNRLASMAWSCNIHWYFVLVPEGIVLLNVYRNVGWLCRKKTYRFIASFLNPQHARQELVKGDAQCSLPI